MNQSRPGCVGSVDLPSRERGAALVIGLILLVILTLLAVAGMNAATTELVMAGNEQFRRNAAVASSAGIERAIARLDTVPTTLTAPPTLVEDALPAADSDDRFDTSTRYVGEERGLPQSSADKFVALHYVIESDGRSARDAEDRQVQGAFVVSGAGSAGGDNYTQIGGGLP